MSVSQSSQPRSDITGFQFKLLTRLKVFASKDGLFTSSTNLLAAASKYGIVFVGCPSGFQVIILSTIVGNLPDSKDGATSYNRRTVLLPSQPSHLILSCDHSHLVVAIRKAGCAHALVYNVPSFMSQNEVIVNEVRFSPSPDVFAVDLSWNPGIANIMASCVSDGSVTVYEFQPSGVSINNIPPESRSTCVSWSPKGKQIVVGSDDGNLTQYKPDMKAVKTLAGPQIPGKQFSVVNVVWISSFQFGAVYRNKANPQEGQALMIVNAPKAGPVTFINFDDACYSTGQLRPPQFYFSHMQQWNMLLVGSGNSVEIGVLGLESNQSSWVQWLFDDGARAELPLTSDTQETFLVGMAVDTSTNYKLPWGESSSESIGPMPVLLMLSHYGILCVYYMVNLLQGYPAICSPPEQLSDLSGLHHFLPDSADYSTAPSQTSLPAVQSTVSSVTTQKPASPQNVFAGATTAPALFGSYVPQIPSAAPTGFLNTQTTVPGPFATCNVFAEPPTQGVKNELFGPNMLLPSTFGKPTFNYGSEGIFGGTPSSTPTLLGTPATTQQPSTTNIFGCGTTSQIATPNIFGGAVTGQTTSATASIFSTPASSFSFATQQTTTAIAPSFGSTPSLGASTGMGDVAKPGFSFGTGFLPSTSTSTVTPQTVVESKPQPSIFGGTVDSFSFNQPVHEQPKLLFSLPNSTTQTESQTAQTIAAPSAAASGDHGYTKQHSPAVSTQLKPQESSDQAPTATEQFQVSSGFGSQRTVSPVVQTQPEENQSVKAAQPPTPTPTGSEKTGKEEAEEIDNSVFIAAIAEEMNHFETALLELQKRVAKINVQVIGTEEEKRNLSCDVESMSEFVRDLKETTQGQVKEINALRTVTFEALAWLEEARSRQQQLKSPRFQQLQQTLDLDHSSARRLANIQHLVYYVDSQLSQVMSQLDCDWLQLQDKCKDVRKSHLEPTVDSIYRTLMAQNAIVNRQRVIVQDLMKRAQPISKHKLDLISNMSLMHVSDKGADSELARLADSLMQVKLGPVKREKLSFKKHEKLMTLLTDRPVTRIRAVRPATSASFLDLPPIKTGSILSGTPIKPVLPVQKLPEVSSQKQFITAQVSQAPVSSTFILPVTTTPVVKVTSVKQALTFSTPVTASGQTFTGPTFGSANKTIQSISKDLTTYYDDVTPPRSPEPDVKHGDLETIPSFNSFSFSVADKSVQNVPAKPASSTFTIPKEVQKTTIIAPKPSGDLLKTTMAKEKPALVVSSVGPAVTTLSQLSSFSFAAPKSTTNIFSGIKPGTTSTQATNVFGTFSFGSTDSTKPSIFGGSPPGGITFGKLKDAETTPKIEPSSVSTVVATSAGQETDDKKAESDNKTVDVKIPTISSGFSFAQPASSAPTDVFGQKSSISTFSFTQVKDKLQPTTTAPTTFSLQVKDTSTPLETSKTVTEISPKSAVTVAPTVEKTVSTSISVPPVVVSEEVMVSTPVTQPTSAMTSFSFAKVSTESSPSSSPTVTADTKSSPAISSDNIFFGQQICSPTSFGQSGGTLFGKPITTSASPSIFGGTSSPKTPILGANSSPKTPVFGVVPEQSKSLTVTSESSTTGVGDSSTAATTPTYVVIEAKSPSTTTPIFGGATIPTTTATNVFGVTITPITCAPASTPSTATSTVPAMIDIKSPTTLTTTTTTTATASSSVTALTSLFGATITPTTSSTSIFGGQSSGVGQSMFGAQNAATSTTTPFTQVFRTNVDATPAASSPSIFGQSTTASPSVFGQTASTTGSVFGGAGDASSTTTASSAFGTSGGSMFGSSTSNLFGGSVATSTPSVFGQSSSQAPSPFGQAATTTQSIFGQAASPTTASSPFVSKPSVFGQAQETTTPAFGAPAAFGQPTQSVFGQSTPGSFGSSGGSMFGGGSSVFGSSSSSGGLFQQSSGGFGSSTSSGGLFSSSNAPSISQTGFGGSSIFQNKPGAFGGSPVFGGSAAFGAAPSFGGAPAFGGAPTFPSPTKVFGSSSPASNTGFGSVSPSQQSSTFENLASQNTMSFGNLAQSQTQGFGSPQQSLFGSPQQSAGQAPSAFSSGTSSFGHDWTSGMSEPTKTVKPNSGSSFSSWR